MLLEQINNIPVHITPYILTIYEWAVLVPLKSGPERNKNLQNDIILYKYQLKMYQILEMRRFKLGFAYFDA